MDGVRIHSDQRHVDRDGWLYGMVWHDGNKLVVYEGEGRGNPIDVYIRFYNQATNEHIFFTSVRFVFHLNYCVPYDELNKKKIYTTYM